MSLLRNRITKTKSREYLKSLQQIETADKIIDEIQFKEINQKVQTLLDQLAPHQKEIYLLSQEEGLTYEEIVKK